LSKIKDFKVSFRVEIRRDLGKGKGRFRPVPLVLPNTGIVQELFVYFNCKKNKNNK